MKKPVNNRLKRYTNLAATIHIIRNKVLTLLNPDSWDDKNDAYYMKKYVEVKKLKNVFALCLTNQTETYHHWSIFAPNMDGICIEFKKDKLVSIMEANDVICGDINYEKIVDIENDPPDPDELPFLKRLPYEDEQEFRLVYPSSSRGFAHDVKIDLSCIDRINISPWMPKALSDSVKETLKLIPNWNGEIKLNRSTLVDSERWKRAADNM